MPEATRVRLSVTDPDGIVGAGRVVTLPVHLGRDPGRSEIEIADRMVSRRHARLEASGDDVVLVDLDSGNGTWIGAEKVARWVLRPGDQITLGTSTVDWATIPAAPAVGTTPEPPSIERPTAAPTFGSAWGVVLHDGRLRMLPLRGLAQAWVRAARSAIALGVLAADADADAAAWLDAHDALDAALDAYLDGEFARLGAYTFAFCAPDRPMDRVTAGLPRMRRLADHQRARSGVAALRTRLGAGDAGTVVGLVAAEDRRLVEHTVAALRSGVEAFSTHGAAVVARAGDDLMASLKAVLVACVERDQRIANHIRVADAPGGSS